MFLPGFYGCLFFVNNRNNLVKYAQLLFIMFFSSYIYSILSKKFLDFKKRKKSFSANTLYPLKRIFLFFSFIYSIPNDEDVLPNSSLQTDFVSMPHIT